MWGRQPGPRWLPGCGPRWNWTLAKPWGHLRVGEGIRREGKQRGRWTRSDSCPSQAGPGILEPNSPEREQQETCQDHTVCLWRSLPLQLPHSLHGSPGLLPRVLPSSGPCRIRYRAVSAPPSSALVTVIQPGQRWGRGVPADNDNCYCPHSFWLTCTNYDPAALPCPHPHKPHLHPVLARAPLPGAGLEGGLV